MLKAMLKGIRNINLGKILAVMGVLYVVLEIAHAVQKSTEGEQARSPKSILDAIKSVM